MPLIKAKFMVYAAGSASRAGSSRWLTSVSSGWDSEGDRRQDGREGAGDWRLAGEGGSAERLDINPSTPRSHCAARDPGAWPPPIPRKPGRKA